MTNRIAIYPGTFDPITLGHIDVVQRSAKLFDKVVLGVSENPLKNTTFTITQRVEMAEKVLANIDNVSVKPFLSLAVSLAKEEGALVLVRGLRAISDFDHEINLASINNQLDSTIETLFLSSAKEFANLSSSMVKQITYYGGDTSKFVHPLIAPYLESIDKKKLL